MTRRQAEKEQRRHDLLEAAGRLFGLHGFASVALDDIGSEVGVTGQAIYRHFRGKQDMLGQLLLGVSAELLDGARGIRAQEADVASRLDRLVAFQVAFALRSPEVIRVQDQEMQRLADADRRRIRRMQREYIELWAAAIGQLHPGAGSEELRTRVHAVFGLINSTAHSMKHHYGSVPSPTAIDDSARALTAMARAAIDCRIDR
ncbi:TetR/AcrR family transcriptional regulator [Nesterenkonia halophila]|uniref:TetR/AcrR family transcriptional regulator n=1 Tax=Nesterenkonia halophila TaxID=302044 RepID=UPI001291E328|nr:TetR family transcriptional regulator [Nesterenkonia halophila]